MVQFLNCCINSIDQIYQTFKATVLEDPSEKGHVQARKHLPHCSERVLVGSHPQGEGRSALNAKAKEI